MPIKFKSNHICEKCLNSFEWCHFELLRQRLDERPLIAEPLPNIPIARTFALNDEGGYNVSVDCPHCRHENHFIFNENRDI